MKLLIHHHVSAFEDQKGIWLQSFIGKWVEELSIYFDEVGLLLHGSSERYPTQDSLIKRENIHFHNLGPKLNFQKSLKRRRNIRSVLTKVNKKYDILLIRGITPRQYTIWRLCEIEKKAYLMVGSIVDARPKLELKNKGLIRYSVFQRRLWELKHILKDSQLFVNSPQICQDMKAHFGLSECLYLPTNTISSKEVDPIPDSIKAPSQERALNLLFVGRVMKDKGIEELILASEKLVAEMKIDLNVQIVGTINDSYKDFLESLHSTAIRIKFHGFVPYGPQLFSFYREADIFVLPSYHEGFPHSIWEAAAMNTPVVTCPVGGIPGIVNEGEVTFCQSRSVDSLTASLKKVIDNWEVAMEKNKKLRKKLHTHTLESVAKRTFYALQGKITTNV